MSFYYWDKTWEEIEEYVKKDAVIILPVGTVFQHEYGTYKVSEHKGEGSEFVILCDRL